MFWTEFSINDTVCSYMSIVFSCSSLFASKRRCKLSTCYSSRLNLLTRGLTILFSLILNSPRNLSSSDSTLSFSLLSQLQSGQGAASVSLHPLSWSAPPIPLPSFLPLASPPFSNDLWWSLEKLRNAYSNRRERFAVTCWLSLGLKSSAKLIFSVLVNWWLEVLGGN